MNKIILTGNLGADPTTREVNGKKVANFNLAVSNGFGDNKKTTWFNCSAWQKTADIVMQFLAKGSKVLVIGEFNPRDYEKDGQKRTSLDVAIREVEIIIGKPNHNNSREAVNDFSDNFGNGFGSNFNDSQDIPF